MERIEKPYAIIYIDWEGETLNVDLESEHSRRDFATNEMISDYYNHPGFLQWNYYLIIPKEIVEANGTCTVDAVENNDIYTRKHVLPKDEIKSFVENRFPDVRPIMGKITLIKGNNWTKCFPLVQAEQLKNKENNELYADTVGSFYRDENLNYALTEMDKIRAKLIINPALNIIFYTHISNEYSLAKKKFDLFIEKPVEENLE